MKKKWISPEMNEVEIADATLSGGSSPDFDGPGTRES